MFWNELTIDMMIIIYIVGLFTLIIVCLYALIQSRANKLYTFVIIPLALLIASMTWQGIKALQGMPIYGLPIEQQVQVMFVHDSKPWIYVLLNSVDGPKFYKIDWSEDNKKKMKDLQRKIGSSEGDGKFKEGIPGEQKSLFFTPMMNLTGSNSKNAEESRELGVTFSTTTPSGSSPTATIDGQSGDTNEASRPNLEINNDDTSFIRGEDRDTIPWSTQFLFLKHNETKTFIGPLNKGEE